ncbi:MAG: hypothetical protein ABIG46_06435 [Candidatus Omnitrophota bacterium]|nr:hypothetical protein [Candidatus Omnitrophota bacterium]
MPLYFYKNKFFYITAAIFLIVSLNLYRLLRNEGKVNLFPGWDKTIETSGFFFKAPNNWPLAVIRGNKEKGEVVFSQQFHFQRYNWYLVFSWDKQDFNWKELLPPLKKDPGVKSEPEYNFGEIYQKDILFQNKTRGFKNIVLWIKRSCGIVERNWLFLFESNNLPGEKFFFKALYLSDKSQEETFRRILASIKFKR